MTKAEKIILAAIKYPIKNEEEFNALKRKLSKGILGKKGTQLSTKTELLVAYHKLLAKKSIVKNKHLEKLLTRRAVRTLSGVTIITSLVKPYACPGECVYCPLDERMPKSYLSEEPAAARALGLKFDPYRQMALRIKALEDNGHPTDKIELIIKGGTWNAYPLAYQYWFILESFRACNTVKRTRNKEKGVTLSERAPLIQLRAELKRQQHLNEKAKHRIIGLTLETRPDCVTVKTLWQMREMGCTRIELGVQHTDDAILELTKRGHDSSEAKRATELLRNFGFKTDFHLMPQLPGATPETDLAMLKTIFTDPAYRPDMIKIYPCSVVKGSELYDWFKQGKYHAYSTDDLIRILKEFKTIVPYYCRISRLIRDIPGQYIEEGNKVTNLRQVIQAELKKEGRACRCLRCREVGHFDINTLKHKNIKTLEPKLFVEKYKTNGGTEYFLSFENKKRQVVFAFCRLRVNDGKSEGPFPAYIRELHTYGQLVKIGNRQAESTQHTGLGKKLILEAEKIVKSARGGLLAGRALRASLLSKKLAVISGVGVRDYYRKLGYKLENTYMVKKLSTKK